MIQEYRFRGAQAQTLSALTTEIAKLPANLEAVAHRARQHEERLRLLERFTTTDPIILALPGPAWINQPKETTEQLAA